MIVAFSCVVNIIAVTSSCNLFFVFLFFFSDLQLPSLTFSFVFQFDLQF